MDYTVQPSASGQNKRKAEDDCYCPPPKQKPLMTYLFDIANGNLTEVASMTLNNMPGQGQKWLNIVFKDEYITLNTQHPLWTMRLTT